MKFAAGFLCLALAAFSAQARAQAPASSKASENFVLIRDAAQAMAAGDLRRAENELQTVLASDAKEYRALNLLGILRAQQRQEAEAEKLFKQSIAVNPDFAASHVDLGLLYVQTNREDEAAAEFQEALRIDPARSDARDALRNLWRQQARNALSAQDSEKALALLLRARKLSPDDPDVLFEFGMVALRMSLFSDAAQALQQVLAQRHDDANALYGLGRAQVGMAKFQDAQQSFERFLQLHPSDAGAHYALGFILLSLQDGERARQEFAKSIELQPVQTESYFQIGMLDLDENHPEDAAARFQLVLNRDPKHAGALTGMGRAEFQQKKYAQAAEFLRRAIAADATVRPAHYYLGIAEARLGQKEDSAKELEIASRLEHEEVEKRHTGLRIEGFDDPAARPK